MLFVFSRLVSGRPRSFTVSNIPDRLGVRRHDVQHDLQPVDPALEVDQEIAVSIPPLTIPSLIEPGPEEGPGVSQPLLGPGPGVDRGPPGQNRVAEKVLIFVADGQLVMGCAADIIFFELGRLVPHFLVAKLLNLRNQLAKQDEGRRQPLLAVDHLEVIEGPQTCPRLLVHLLQQDRAEVVIAVAEVVEIVPQIPEVLLLPGVAALVDGDLEQPVAREELVQRRQCAVHRVLVASAPSLGGPTALESSRAPGKVPSQLARTPTANRSINLTLTYGPGERRIPRIVRQAPGDRRLAVKQSRAASRHAGRCEQHSPSRTGRPRVFPGTVCPAKELGHDRRLPHLAGVKVFGDSLRVCVKAVSCRSRNVNRTCGGDSQKAVPSIHKDAFPDLFSFHAVTAPCPGVRGADRGNRRWTGATPPFLLPGSGTVVLRNSHLRSTPWEGRSRLIHP